VSDRWLFEGWAFQDGGEPVSAGTLRTLLAAGFLKPTDMVWKVFKKNGQTDQSSPVTVETAVKDDNSSDPELSL
jgi:hypothetical protein